MQNPQLTLHTCCPMHWQCVLTSSVASCISRLQAPRRATMAWPWATPGKAQACGAFAAQGLCPCCSCSPPSYICPDPLGRPQQPQQAHFHCKVRSAVKRWRRKQGASVASAPASPVFPNGMTSPLHVALNGMGMGHRTSHTILSATVVRPGKTQAIRQKIPPSPIPLTLLSGPHRHRYWLADSQHCLHHTRQHRALRRDTPLKTNMTLANPDFQ